MTTSEDAKYKNFEDNKVSVKTIVLITNLVFDLQKLFDILPTTDYVVVPKRRGRKRKDDRVNLNVNVPKGSIITVRYKGKVKGVEIERKMRTEKNNDKYFRNSITVVMVVDTEKIINFKVSRNGKFQITGCRTNQHAEDCFMFFQKYIQKYKNTTHTLTGDLLEVLYIPAMRNIDFNLNFLIDREKLSMYINMNTEYHAILESSIGYTGVNIKLPLEVNVFDLPIKKCVCDMENDRCEKFTIPYLEYINTLTEKERRKKIEKERHNTFLVFHSGKCIMSGMSSFCMKNSYVSFMEVIDKCRDVVMEKLESE